MGNKNRTTEETNANETSSRSHAILNIMVSYKEKGLNENKEIKYAKLNLIDLAGSERASVTKNKGMRLIEGANINKSLLTLGNCINALSEKSEKGSKIYIPYRDSKLTRLLKDSLGGNSRTIMIANISPFIYNFDDTYNTLKYAERAKCIKTKVKLNILEKNQVNNYLQNKEKDGYILLAILYEDDVIGEIRFKGIEDSCSEIGIVLKNDRYKNKGMGTIALTKALDYAKDNLKLNKIVAKILKTNKRSQHIFEKIGFVFYDEDEHFDKFYKNI
jgi:GNAT superfamily N-acetyltransferase